MNKNYFKGLLAVIFGAFIVFAFAQSEENNMTVTELKEAITKNKNLVILDVRTPAELTSETGKIPGVINIPVQELGDRIGELEKYKEKEIAVICRSGNRSRHATKLLLESGYKAKNVAGGMIEWRKSGN